MKRKEPKGQALVEWTIFGMMVMGLWIISLRMANRLLDRTTTEAFSVIGARKALSQAKFSAPPNVRFHLGQTPTKAMAKVWANRSQEDYQIEIPKTEKGFWWSNSPLFGFPSFSSSE